MDLNVLVKANWLFIEVSDLQIVYIHSDFTLIVLALIKLASLFINSECY